MSDTTERPATRIERDSMGEMEVPADALYGASTQRAVLNFPISGQPLPRELIRALALVKAAAAQTNADLGLLDRDVAEAISGEMWGTKSELETNYLEFINKANETCKLNFNVGVKLTTFDISQFGELPNVPSDGTALLYSKDFSEIKDKYSNFDIEEDVVNKCCIWIDSTSSHDKDLFNTNKHHIDIFCSIGKN